MNEYNGFDVAEQQGKPRKWIGNRDIFLQTFPTAAWRIVPAADSRVFAGAIAFLESKQGEGIYWGVNPMKPRTAGTPGNDDIARRRRLFLDVDHPDHDLKISATDAGKKISRDVFDRIITFLIGMGWPTPVKIDSGSGHHGFWPIDLPNDEEIGRLIRSFLCLLAAKFGPLVDTAVHDARRLGRVPGTWNRKGKPTAERPHRLCVFIELPELADIVTADMIRAAIKVMQSEDLSCSIGGGERPGDDFNLRAAWEDILEPANWRIDRKMGVQTYWTRPNKNEGTSATTGYCKTEKSGDLLYVFSSNAKPFEPGKAYSKIRRVRVSESFRRLQCGGTSVGRERIRRPR